MLNKESKSPVLSFRPGIDQQKYCPTFMILEWILKDLISLWEIRSYHLICVICPMFLFAYSIYRRQYIVFSQSYRLNEVQLKGACNINISSIYNQWQRVTIPKKNIFLPCETIAVIIPMTLWYRTPKKIALGETFIKPQSNFTISVHRWVLCNYGKECQVKQNNLIMQ